MTKPSWGESWSEIMKEIETARSCHNRRINLTVSQYKDFQAEVNRQQWLLDMEHDLFSNLEQV